MEDRRPVAGAVAPAPRRPEQADAGPAGCGRDVSEIVWPTGSAGVRGAIRGGRVGCRGDRLLGRIGGRELGGNVSSGAPRRNRLFMAASQSLYAVYVETQGANIT